ncbi:MULTISPECIES: hypothetical protein [Sorangium]|uniref:hypothetical protein n=1 Tax=Sorangium TaxID=39643 RepID=UPI003D9C423D
MKPGAVQKIADDTERLFKKQAQEVASLAGHGRVIDFAAAQAAVADYKQAARSTSALPGDVIHGVLRTLARTAPEAIGTIANAVLHTVKQAERSTHASTAYSSEFHRALAGLSAHGVDMELVGQALQLWHRICAEACPPEPIVEVTSDGGLRFAWSTGRVYLDVEVYRDGTTEWFFKDRRSGQADGTDDERHTDLPPRFYDFVRGIDEHK